jgi:hypothetical protein
LEHDNVELVGKLAEMEIELKKMKEKKKKKKKKMVKKMGIRE